MGSILHAATESDIARLARLADASRLLEPCGSLAEYWQGSPWRVQVSTRGEMAIVAPWRSHRDLLSIRGIWATEERVSGIVGSLQSLAAAHGFSGLLSPLVDHIAAAPYEEAGMAVREKIVSMRRHRGAQSPDSHWNVTTASETDAPELLSLDARSFDDFWRFDEGTLADRLRIDRATVVRKGAHAVGYALSGMDGAVGVVGRVAVVPEARGQGVAAALLEDAVRRLERSGATETVLVTQESNKAARDLYEAHEFVEDPTPLFLMQSQNS